MWRRRCLTMLLCSMFSASQGCVGVVFARWSNVPVLPRTRDGRVYSFDLIASASLQESEYAVSPSTPLLSTAIDENGWVCGQFPRLWTAIRALFPFYRPY